jgi:nucleotide-binding universal stress UspA family protein
MFKRILVPTDGSESSRLAFLNAIDIGRLTGAEILLLHVSFTPQSYWGNNLAYEVNISEEELVQLGNDVIQETRKEIDPGDLTVNSKVVFGSAAQKIIKIAKDTKTDLIIMGSRGQGPFSGAFLGSVSQRVLARANCPVMVVKAPTGVEGE